MVAMGHPSPKPVIWLGDSLGTLRACPQDVQDEVGYALYLAQIGGKYEGTKPLKGFGGAGVLELVDDFDGETYRAVYAVKFAGAVYALHASPRRDLARWATDNNIDFIGRLGQLTHRAGYVLDLTFLNIPFANTAVRDDLNCGLDYFSQVIIILARG